MIVKAQASVGCLFKSGDVWGVAAGKGANLTMQSYWPGWLVISVGPDWWTKSARVFVLPSNEGSKTRIKKYQVTVVNPGP